MTLEQYIEDELPLKACIQTTVSWELFEEYRRICAEKSVTIPEDLRAHIIATVEEDRRLKEPEPEPEREIKRRDRRSNAEMREIVELLKEYKDGFTSKEIAERFGRNQSTTLSNLNTWFKRGYIRKYDIILDNCNVYRAVDYTEPIRIQRVNHRTVSA